MNTPWNPVPGWDVPSDYYAPDAPDYDWESLLLTFYEQDDRDRYEYETGGQP